MDEPCPVAFQGSPVYSTCHGSRNPYPAGLNPYLAALFRIQFERMLPATVTPGVLPESRRSRARPVSCRDVPGYATEGALNVPAFQRS